MHLCHRFLEAAKDLKAGELILEEDPLVVGPVEDSEPICIGCYASIELHTAAR